MAVGEDDDEENNDDDIVGSRLEEFALILVDDLLSTGGSNTEQDSGDLPERATETPARVRSLPETRSSLGVRVLVASTTPTAATPPISRVSRGCVLALSQLAGQLLRVVVSTPHVIRTAAEPRVLPQDFAHLTLPPLRTSRGPCPHCGLAVPTKRTGISENGIVRPFPALLDSIVPIYVWAPVHRDPYGTNHLVLERSPGILSTTDTIEDPVATLRPNRVGCVSVSACFSPMHRKAQTSFLSTNA
ncbi:hypothetical protein K488DRAFT_88182 [Vararia minispora EC-137]|uniref:Uncharacterized protein n=1 Tax=Vararia minispora EC-137 TaxID=1314806 RepID=A0ACB8QDT4_9AGAM|nr:hypothetical protein K488DRAFT_88182 [Vararia minispora EC-137]